MNEADLRRIYQLMVTAAEKLNDPRERFYIYVRTENGTIHEFDSIDEVFALDNIGEQFVNHLYLSIGNSDLTKRVDALSSEPEWSVSVQFERISLRRHAETPTIRLDVIGPTRDWVVLTAGELEERIKRTHSISIARYFSDSNMSFITIFLLLAFMAGLLMTVPTPEPIHQKLEGLRANGQIKDAVDAVIAAERLKQPDQAIRDTIFRRLIGGLIGLAFFTVILPRFAMAIGRPYEFLWGEYVAVNQRRKAIESTVLIVVVLGLFVGVASTWTSKQLGL
ncbi:MAG: hypothetical protein Q8M49_00105 [Limnobacter sp.]|nr:hypothetical protein [Limnobacter sp.]